jgi:hypothetical protein
MASKPVKSELQHDFGRTRWPCAFAFNILEALEKAADVEQEACEFRANRIERAANLLCRTLCLARGATDGNTK